jgi:signal peptidase I
MEETNKKETIIDAAKKYLPSIWEVLKIVIIASAIVLPIRYFLFQPFIVKGESMVPNFENGDYLIVDEISYRFATPERGEVIVFKYPKDESQRFIKRIIGLPGETVIVREGVVTIKKGETSFVLEEGYLPVYLKTIGDVETTLGVDEYFVLGDNRDRSYDSRSWGVVPKEEIIGKVLLRILPVAGLSKIATPSY